jgi:hypothetical protein
MNYTISSALVKSDPQSAYPNGEFVGRGTVSYFNNSSPRDKFNPTKVAGIAVSNENGIEFFKADRELSVDAIRAIANALSEIADKAQEAHDDLIKVNVSGLLDKR